MALEAEATPSKLQRSPHLVTGQAGTLGVSTAVSEVASEDEAVAVAVAVASEEASEVIEVGLAEVSEAIGVGMEEEVGLATKVVVASVVDHQSEHPVGLEVDEAATTTRETATVVVGMAEAVTVARLAATETRLAVTVVVVEIDTTTATAIATAIGMAADDETMTMALESDTTTETLMTTRDQNADTKGTKHQPLAYGSAIFSPVVLVLQLSITVCWWVWCPLICVTLFNCPRKSQTHDSTSGKRLGQVFKVP